MKFRTRPFDVETVFVQAKKRQKTKKLRGPDSPLYMSIWPMIYVLRVFGLAPYDFSQDRLIPSNIYLIFTVIAATLYTYIFYVVTKLTIGTKRDDSAVLGGTDNTKVILNYSVTMYELGLVAFTRRRFTKIWNALQDYDEDVRQLGFPRKERQTAIVAWILSVAIAAIWISVNRIGMYAFHETWLYNMGYLLIYVASSMALFKFVAMVFFLGQRFHHLNVMAIKNLPPTSARKNIIISKRTILTLHNDLMIAAENLESLYSWSLLFWLGNLGLHTVSNIYFIIDWTLMNPWNKVTWSSVYCLSGWLMAVLFQLLLLHIACHYACSQANCISPILIEWQMRLIKRNHECVDSSMQFLNRRLNFSAGGCFYVNLPLLCSTAALLTTYLVILMQLH
ncbi:Gustatory receptor [Camponotus japonicus]